MATQKQDEQQKKPRYIVLDIVFYASSLNYDQGSGSYQELKKITQWDGSVKIMTSRYALRYSILEHAAQAYPNEWKLAGPNELSTKSKVVQKAPSTNALDFPEFDLFGYLIATKKDNEEVDKEEDKKTKGNKKGKKGNEGQQEARVSPVKISHAISLNSYNFDSHFTANLGMMKRAGETGSNPVNMEEFKGFYVFNVTIDINRIGVLDGTSGENNGVRAKRIEYLLKTLMYLKRDIKGKREDLSPWLVVAGDYENMNYDTYMDRIELLKSKSHTIKRREKQTNENGYTVTEVEHQESSDAASKPKFKIHELSANQTIFQRSDIEVDGRKFEETKKDDFVSTLLKKADLK